MKITKDIFKSFKGLGKLKKMKKETSCNGIQCSDCPLGNDNIPDYIECLDIIELGLYKENNPEAVETMNNLIDIFTEEKISKNLLLIDKRLKYNSKVMYNGKPYNIKGVLKKKLIEDERYKDPILLNGFCDNYNASYKDCIVKESDMNKKYTLWVDLDNIDINE